MKRYEKLPGTRDFYPDDMYLRRWIEDRWREVGQRYGFEEYDAPLMEPLDLFTDKSGDEIADQLYAFSDRGDRVVALRPEMTPSLARMVAARAGGLPKPIKWFSIPRLFRYERPQRGRFREFWQLNLDIIGVEGVEADAEIIAAGVEALRVCGLTNEDFEVRYSDRRLLDAVLGAVGIGVEQRPGTYAALDKLARAGPDAVVEILSASGVDESVAQALVTAVGGRRIEGLQALDIEPTATAADIERIDRLRHYLDGYGVGEYCVFDLSVVRGLAYYTGVVFEMYDLQGEFRALCGGGRYDDLLSAIGGADLPAVGFGLGEAVLVELLAARARLPAREPRCEVFVIPVSADEHAFATRVVTNLRNAGIVADIALRKQSVGKALRSAVQAGAAFAAVVGERERESGSVTLRDLEEGSERTIDADALLAEISRRGDTAGAD